METGATPVLRAWACAFSTPELNRYGLAGTMQWKSAHRARCGTKDSSRGRPSANPIGNLIYRRDIFPLRRKIVAL